MNRQELAAYLTDTYSTTGEHLFARGVPVHWLSAARNGTEEDEMIRFQTDMSYELTKGRGGAFPLFAIYAYSRG